LTQTDGGVVVNERLLGGATKGKSQWLAAPASAAWLTCMVIAKSGDV